MSIMRVAEEFKHLFDNIKIINADFKARKNDSRFIRINHNKIKVTCLSDVEKGADCLLFKHEGIFYIFSNLEVNNYSYTKEIEFRKQQRKNNIKYEPFKILYAVKKAENINYFTGGHTKNPLFIASVPDSDFSRIYSSDGRLTNNGRDKFYSLVSYQGDEETEFFTSIKRKKVKRDLDLNARIDSVYYWMGHDVAFTYDTSSVRTSTGYYDDSIKELVLLTGNNPYQIIPMVIEGTVVEEFTPTFDNAGRVVYSLDTLISTREVNFFFTHESLDFYYEEGLRLSSETENTYSYNAINNVEFSSVSSSFSDIRNIDFVLPVHISKEFVLYAEYSEASTTYHQRYSDTNSVLTPVSTVFNGSTLDAFRASMYGTLFLQKILSFNVANISFVDGRLLEVEYFNSEINHFEEIKPFYFDKIRQTTSEIDSSYSGNLNIDIPVEVSNLPSTYTVFWGDKEDANGIAYFNFTLHFLLEPATGKRVVYYKKINHQFYEFKGFIASDKKTRYLGNTLVSSNTEFDKLVWQLDITFESYSPIPFFHRDNYLIVNPYSINGFCFYLNWANNLDCYIRTSSNTLYRYHRFLDYFDAFSYPNNLSSSQNKLYISHVDISSVKNNDGVGYAYVFEIANSQISFIEVVSADIFGLKIKPGELYKDLAISYHPKT